MQPFVFKMRNDSAPLALRARIGAWQTALAQLLQFDSPWGYIYGTLLALLLGRMIAAQGITAATLMLVGLALVPGLLIALFHVRFGLVLLLSAAFFLPWIKRISGDFPVSIFIDGGILALLFGVFLRQVYMRDWRFVRNPVTPALLVWGVYCLLELLNPLAPSRVAWVYAVREYAGHGLVYFVAAYAVSQWKHLGRLTFWMLLLAALGAVYGLLQEVYGLNRTEQEWLLAGPAHGGSLFASGRKFSVFSHPSIFGAMMGSAWVLALALADVPWMRRPYRLLLIGLLVLLLPAMLISASRTGFLALGAGLAFLTLLGRWRPALAGWAVTGLLAAGLLLYQGQNERLLHLQEMFRPAEMASMVQQLENESYVRSYILRHPMGSGLGSTGAWGERFSPESMLSQFPASGGYLRVALESGWVGLLLYCLLLLTALVSGVRQYFRLADARQRAWHAAYLSLLFALVVAHYTHPVLMELPLSLIAAVSLGVLARTGSLEGQPPAPLDDRS
jgi:hypothetical protein